MLQEEMVLPDNSLFCHTGHKRKQCLKDKKNRLSPDLDVYPLDGGEQHPGPVGSNNVDDDESVINFIPI